eukprot:Filipodium_phascolosomae@DN6742_c0_g1_i1.p1
MNLMDFYYDLKITAAIASMSNNAYRSLHEIRSLRELAEMNSQVLFDTINTLETAAAIGAVATTDAVNRAAAQRGGHPGTPPRSPLHKSGTLIPTKQSMLDKLSPARSRRRQQIVNLSLNAGFPVGRMGSSEYQDHHPTAAAAAASGGGPITSCSQDPLADPGLYDPLLMSNGIETAEELVQNIASRELSRLAVTHANSKRHFSLSKLKSSMSRGMSSASQQATTAGRGGIPTPNKKQTTTMEMESRSSNSTKKARKKHIKDSCNDVPFLEYESSNNN